MSDDVRGVIARATASFYWPEFDKPERFAYLHIEYADAILAALHNAGYEVVEREPLERVLDALVESAQRDLDAILRGEHHTP